MNYRISKTRKVLVGLVAGAFLLASSQMAFADDKEHGAKAKNVILMISDGQGFNAVRATNYYTCKPPVYESFKHKYGMQTYSAGIRGGYVGAPYDPAQMATNFNYANSYPNGPTDSASAATAMYTGVKVYDNEVNYTPDRQVLTTYFEKAAKAGKSIGAVSSVEFTHATPVAVYGHNSHRNNYSAMAHEAIYGSNPVNDLPNAAPPDNPLAGDNNNYDAQNYYGKLKVIIGTGHPAFNANGLPQAADYRYVGGATAWTDLQGGVNGWTFIESKEDFKAYAKGTMTADKLFGVAQNFSTVQQGRTLAAKGPDINNPSGIAFNDNVPTLVDMTKAALSVLDDNRKGFAVMIEGGAIDWAGHAGQLDRIIEEQIDFNNAVKAVAKYLDNDTKGNNWGNTLLIVTADHETGYLWGNGAGPVTSFFDVNDNGVFEEGIDYPHLGDNGCGNLPDGKFYSVFLSGSYQHTNSLVPLYAKGAGSEDFKKCVVGRDPNLRAIYDLDRSWSGKYIDNTCIFTVMESASLKPHRNEWDDDDED
jgi:alkaline phosphatase